MPEDGMAL